MRFAFSSDDWPLRIRQVRNWAIVLILLGCYLLFKKENILTALVKTLSPKKSTDDLRVGSKACGVLCFWFAGNEILTLLANFYEKEWLKFVPLILYVVLLVAALIYDAYKKKHKPK